MTDLPFYAGSINAATYDLAVGRGGPGTVDDIAFYQELAGEAGPRILELACGTGRVSIPLAEAGFEVTGVDRSSRMLQVAEAKRAALAPGIADRVRFVQGDMAVQEVGSGFDIVIIPFRSFAFLLEVESQRACLRLVHRQLRPGGTLCLQVFDPRLDLCVPGAGEPRVDEGIIPDSDHRLRVEVRDRVNDPLAQVLRETWRFTELSAASEATRVEEEVLTLRWTYRYEMRHLLELSGFEDLVEYSDFRRSAPAYGAEQVWVARRPVDG